MGDGADYGQEEAAQSEAEARQFCAENHHPCTEASYLRRQLAQRDEQIRELEADNEKMHAQDKAISVVKCKTCEEYVPGRYLRDGLCPSCLKAENKRLKAKVEIALEWLQDAKPAVGVIHWKRRQKKRLDAATTNRMNADAAEKGGG